LQQQERQPWRCERRVLRGTLVQRRKQALLRLDERGLVRGPVTGPEREPLQWQERLPFPALLQWQERGPAKGQELPPPSGG